MTIQTIQSQQFQVFSQQPPTTSPSQPPVASPQQSSGLEGDKVEIQSEKKAGPVGKAIFGGLIGGTAAFAATAIPSLVVDAVLMKSLTTAATFGGPATYLGLPAAGLSGVISGAITLNADMDTKTSTLTGAGIGLGLGVLAGALTKSAAVGAIVAGFGGVGGGVSSYSIASMKVKD